jgi:hypothetical protein
MLIWVKFDVVGFHAYVTAPDAVDYLKNVHRHRFNFKVGLSVTEFNRELEFHMVKRQLLQMLGETFPKYGDPVNNEYDFRGMSCETMGNKLYERIQQTWPERDALIEIDEDGEAGMVLCYTGVTDA